MRGALRNALRVMVSGLLLSALLSWTGEVSAQATGRIVGLVTDGATQAPMAGVQVFIPGTQHGTLTNQDGRSTVPLKQRFHFLSDPKSHH